MFFIPIDAIPKGRKATYLQVVSAFALKNPTQHAVSDGLSVATKLITLSVSAQKQLISQWPSSSSTVFCQLPMHGLSADIPRFLSWDTNEAI
jgi:hypothetical protein